jgi:hypothetical protein
MPDPITHHLTYLYNYLCMDSYIIHCNPAWKATILAASDGVNLYKEKIDSFLTTVF